jgi:DUF4097 and DUF4098 domain-containing protein YvlB
MPMTSAAMGNTRAWRITLLALLLATGGMVTPMAGQDAQDWCREDGRDGDREQVCEVRQFTLAPTAGVLSVEGTNGGIEVAGQARGDVLVLAKVTARADTLARARQIAGAVKVDASLDRVSADGPRTEDGDGWSVSYRLAVPRALNLSLKTTNGGIVIQDVDSKVEFRTVNGGVKLRRLDGDVRGQTTNGGVDVELEGTGWLGEGLDVATTNGGVKLLIPEHYSAQLEAQTNNGGLSLDVPGAPQNRRNRHAAVQLGSGGAPIRVRTSNGGIRVSRK